MSRGSEQPQNDPIEQAEPDPISQAQRRVRENQALLARARAAVLETVRDPNVDASTDVVMEVARTEGLEVEIVQRAVWGLVHDGEVQLTDDLELKATQ